jgi:hypothetical protein
VLIVACQASPGLRTLDRKYPGAPADFICRTRCIDARLNDELERGFDRIVVFGTGYAIRLGRDWTSSPRVIEIDRPATQRSKTADRARPRPSGFVVPHCVGRKFFNTIRDRFLAIVSDRAGGERNGGAARPRLPSPVRAGNTGRLANPT